MDNIGENVPGEVDVSSVADEGEWLVAHRGEMDRGEAVWLSRLAEFDLGQGWAADGQLSCANWLMWRAGMARATAYEKLRIAHQLRRRHVVDEALSAGRISYSAARAICRIDRPDEEVDEALVNLAQAGSVEDVERMVRCWQLHADQHRPPADPYQRRGLRVIRGHDGTGRIEITLTELEIEEVAASLQAYLDRSKEPPTESAAADSTEGAAAGVAADVQDQSAHPDSSGDAPGESAAADWAPEARCRNWPERRADAFMELVRVGLAHHDAPGVVGADRYMVHVVHHAGVTTLVDGRPLDVASAGRVCCDCSVVEHIVGEDGEPLYLGRRTREWSAAQRRAILVRDGGHCRFPGCWNRHVDIHHQQPWEDGGCTDISNGYAACDQHHGLVHAGFTSVGDANGNLIFYRPDGTELGATGPVRRL